MIDDAHNLRGTCNTGQEDSREQLRGTLFENPHFIVSVFTLDPNEL